MCNCAAMKYYVISAVVILLVCILALLRFQLNTDNNAQDYAFSRSNNIAYAHANDNIHIPNNNTTEQTFIAQYKAILDNHTRSAAVKAIMLEHQPEILIQAEMYESLLKDKFYNKREYIDNHGIEKYDETVIAAESAMRDLRKLENDMFDKISHHLSENELLNYKIKHSHLGMRLTEYLKKKQIDIPYSSVQGIYKLYVARYAFIDKHLDGSEVMLSKFLRDYGEHEDPENELHTEYFKIRTADYGIDLQDADLSRALEIMSFDIYTDEYSDRVSAINKSIERQITSP